MEASSEWLEKKGFHLDFVLHHKELIPFVKSYIRKKNFFTYLYILSNLLSLTFLIFVTYLLIHNNICSGSDCFMWFGFGCALPFLLIPIHEGLHGLAYKIVGAPKVDFAANWKELYFMAVADKFVISRNHFYFVALLPFLVISLAFILLTLFSTGGASIMYLTALLVHASMCAGDFGLMSYFIEKDDQEVVTYDDFENARTYFYVK